jgi:hypothetical protein
MIDEFFSIHGGCFLDHSVALTFLFVACGCDGRDCSLFTFVWPRGGVLFALASELARGRT